MICQILENSNWDSDNNLEALSKVLAVNMTFASQNPNEDDELTLPLDDVLVRYLDV